MERCYLLGEFARQNDIGLTTVRGEIKAGRLAARKVGWRTIITAEDAGLAGTVAKNAAAFAPRWGAAMETIEAQRPRWRDE